MLSMACRRGAAGEAKGSGTWVQNPRKGFGQERGPDLPSDPSHVCEAVGRRWAGSQEALSLSQTEVV